MTVQTKPIRSTFKAVILCLPLASGAAFAQETEGSDQTDPDATQSQDMAQQQQQPGAGSGQSGGGGQQGDAVLATVGGSEIRGSDVMEVVGMLPPRLQSQPPQLLLPIALDQLIFRELILAEARNENLADDPEVADLIESSAQTAQDDAMVQIWLTRRMDQAVTDSAVQQLYDDAQAQGQGLPPLDQVRPQIEQYLRQQAIQQAGAELRQGADIVLFDPTGRPMDPQGDAGGSGGTAGGQNDASTGGDTQSGDSATAQDGQSSEGDGSDGSTANN